jgi:amino acid transporter
MTTPHVATKGSFARTIKAVAWSFVGIRKNSEYQDDLRKLNPFHVVLVGIGAAMLLVLGLILLVNVVAG